MQHDTITLNVPNPIEEKIMKKYLLVWHIRSSHNQKNETMVIDATDEKLPSVIKTQETIIAGKNENKYACVILHQVLPLQ